MPYKTILVHLDVGARAGARLDLACQLARRFDAHLVGVHALTEIRVPGYAAMMTGQSGQLAEFQAHAAAELRERSEVLFRKRVQAAGSTRRSIGRRAWTRSKQYRCTRGMPTSWSPGSRPIPTRAVSSPLRRAAAARRRPAGAGRPLRRQLADAGKRVLVAWNASREATRADRRDPLPARRDRPRHRVRSGRSAARRGSRRRHRPVPRAARDQGDRVGSRRRTSTSATSSSSRRLTSTPT